MGAFAKRKPKIAVRTEWFRLVKGNRPLAFWGEVGRRVKERRIRHLDLGRVAGVVAEVEAADRQRRHTLAKKGPRT